MPDAIRSSSEVKLLERDARAIESYLDDQLKQLADAAPPRLIEAIRYSLFAAGKRLRPALVFAAYRACAKPSDAHEPSRSALAAAGAIELIHTFSLVHDDLPAMDDDDLRRGRPTNHIVYGEALAILAGDAMVSLAFQLIATSAEPALVAPLVNQIAAATGPIGMIGGQVLDMAGEDEPSHDLERLVALHRMKTGALLTCAARCGAIAAGATAEQLAAVSDFGAHLGLAFQIIDDVLDVSATSEQLGKQTNKDAGRNKNTYPALLGMDRSRAEAAAQLDRALAALTPFADRAEALRDLARFVVHRSR